MVLDTSGIKNGHTEFSRECDLKSVNDELPPIKNTVTCATVVDRDRSTIMVQLNFHGSFILECARCLENYVSTISGTLRLVLIECEGKKGRAPDEDVADYYFNEHDFIVDVSPSLFDEMMIALPMKPLCSEKCKGIEVKSVSSRKGAKDDECDPRWDALKKLKMKTDT
jgi:uncharacterized protein